VRWGWPFQLGHLKRGNAPGPRASGTVLAICRGRIGFTQHSVSADRHQILGVAIIPRTGLLRAKQGDSGGARTVARGGSKPRSSGSGIRSAQP